MQNKEKVDLRYPSLSPTTANAQGPAIRALAVDLLNELHPEVDECHRNKAGQKLQEEIEEKSRLIEASIAIRRQYMLARKASEDDAIEMASEASHPSTNNGRKRACRPPNRFSLFVYEEDEEYVVLRRQRRGRREESPVDIYEICLAGITNDVSAESTSRKGKRKLRFEGDTFEDNAFDPDKDSYTVIEDNLDDSDLTSIASSELVNLDPTGKTTTGEKSTEKSAGNTCRQLLAAGYEATLRGEAALRDFVSETQPNDETRHWLALL
ncbi:hypothetical protein OIDMADRAFT_30857 [Oidiodendron maius Zn]|uniref:Uncharacterized protein n=1 Tax=Oidiodendron maius (strain Zn) TaxID=913774 RepID=A0A0C3CJX7_OIDMZ|nr:hypothetical protein OIDMADRAFT_30857 [Oidiodendron maius Zn]